MHRVSRRQQASYDEGYVASVLAAAGIDIASEVPSDYIIYCPYHSNHRTPAGEVSKSTGTFYCFSCNAVASLEELVMHVTGKTYFESLRIVGSPKLDVGRAVAKMDVSEEFEEFDGELIKRLHDSLNSRAIKYLADRGITALDEFDIGYSANRDSIIVPVHTPTGMPVGFQARSVEGKEFSNTPGLPKRRLLFNLHRVRTSPYVYVLESPMDVIRCHQLGIPAVSTFGAGVTKEQNELVFKYFPEVYVVPDRDDAGRKMALTMMKMGARLVPVPEGYKDVGQMDDEGIKQLLNRDILAGLF